MKLKLSLRCIAALLTIAILATTLPLVLVAEGLAPKDELRNLGELTEKEEAAPPSLIDPYEEISLREGNVKHFRLEDGSYVAVQYPGLVHRQDDEGNWVDINNHLSLSGGEYTSENAKIKLVKKITGNGSIFTIHEGDHKIELSLDGAIKKTEGIAINTKTEFDETATTLQKMMTLDNLSTRVVYADILSGVDLEYVIDGLHIKENLYIKEKRDTYSYTFFLKLNNLTAHMAEDGSVHISNPISGEDVYVIPLGYMFDADGAESSAVAYSLTDQGNGSYHLTVTPDANWINAEDRAFPVCVDPPLLSVEASSYEGTHISTASPNANYASDINLKVGYQTIGFVKATLPTLPTDAYIYDATLSAEAKTMTGILPTLRAHKISTAWTASTLTYNIHMGAQDGRYQSGYSDQGYPTHTWQEIDWNITRYIKDWYSEVTPNYGIAFTADYLGTGAVSYAELKKDTFSMCIRYYRLGGIESYWSYSQASAGLAGTGYVNLATGGLSFAIDTLACTDSLFGYMPTLVYNQSMAGKFYHSGNADVAYYTQKAGYGFILSVNETIIIGPDTDGIATDVDSYIWIDGDGTSHEFLPVVGNGSVTHYVDTDGMQLTLTPTATGFTMEDQSHVKRHFVTSTTSAMVDGSAALSAIEDPVGNRLEFSLDTYSKVYAISLRPVGMFPILLLQLEYNTAGLVTCIKRPSSGESIRFYYSNTYQSSIASTNSGFLRKMERIYGDTTLTSTFTYDASGKLITAYDATNAYGIAFTYTGNQVTEMSEFAGSDSTAGQTLGFTYRVGGAEVRSSGSDDTYGNSDDIVTHYVFDEQARAVSLYSTNVDGTTFYGGTSGTYATQENAKNNLSSTFSFGGTNTNYLYNAGFEKKQNSLSSPFLGWVTSAGWSSYNTEGICGLSAKATVTFQTPRTMKQTVYLEAGQYVFSIDLTHYEAKSTQVILSATSTTNSSTSFSKRYSTSDLLEGSDTYTIVLSFYAPLDGAYEIGVSVNPDSGLLVNSFVGFDNAMLVRSSATEGYNMVDFGSFDDFRSEGNSTTAPLDAWTTDGTIVSAEQVGEDAMFGNMLKLDNAAARASQIIYRDTRTPTAALLTKSPSYTFSVSGMAKGFETILSNSSKFEIQLAVTYCIPKYDDDGNLDGYTVDTQTTSLCFLKDCNDWQYAFASITFPSCLITKVEVHCLYSGHIGAGYFDKVSVTVQKSISGTLARYNDDGKVEIMQEGNYLQYYFYDEKGRVEATLDSENCFLLYSYDDNTNQVISVTEREHIDEALYDCITNEEPTSVDNVINNYLNILKYKTEYTYNSYGLLTACTVSGYNGTTAKEPDNSPRALYNTSQTYAITSGSKIFGATLTSTDTMGAVTRYFYDEARGLLLAVIEPDNTGTVYQYDEVGNMTGVLPATYTASNNSYSAVTGEEQVTYTYDSHLWLSEIETESTTYSFSYNVFGQTEGISVGNTEIVSHTYEEQGGKLISTTYANGTTVEYVYNDRSQLAEVWHQYGAVVPDEPTYTYLYNEDGTLARFDDNRNGEAYIYEYDAAGRISAYIKCSIDGTVVLFSASCSYNQSGKLSAFKYAGQHGSGTSAIQYSVSNSFTYQSDGRLSTHIIQANSATLQSGYAYKEYSGDTHHSTAVFLGGSEEKAFSIAKAWIYEHSDGTYRTSPTSFEWWYNGSKNNVYEFTYDANGNITNIIHKDPKSTSTSPVVSYHYDDLGQLIREDNFILDCTIVYEYDNAGNIKAKKLYDYTDPDDEVEQALNIASYRYSSVAWGDQLTSFCGNAITYDANGNPVEYYNGFNFTWVNGSELATATKGTNVLSFSYDDNGVRVRKTVNGVDHLYTVNGSQILAEEWGNELLVYLYDANGAPIGMEYRNSTYTEGEYDLYTFQTNMFGDVSSVYNESGALILSYTYNAWGIFIEEETAVATEAELSIARLNPFRYRGYYYDTELGLYYLNARYYDPNTGRFISADSISYLGVDGSLIGYNLYAYCDNNPVMYADPSGHWLETVFDLFSLGVSIVEVVINPYDPLNWAGLAGDALDLIPFITGIGETVKGVKIVAKGVDIADDAYDTIKIMKVVDLTDDAWDAVRGLDRAGDFTQSTMSAGRRIHKGYRVNFPGKEFNKITGIRLDSFDQVGRTVFELKPYNFNSLRAGVSQLSRYRRIMGKGYIWILELY